MNLCWHFPIGNLSPPFVSSFQLVAWRLANDFQTARAIHLARLNSLYDKMYTRDSDVTGGLGDRRDSYLFPYRAKIRRKPGRRYRQRKGTGKAGVRRADRAATCPNRKLYCYAGEVDYDRRSVSRPARVRMEPRLRDYHPSMNAYARKAAPSRQYLLDLYFSLILNPRWGSRITW